MKITIAPGLTAYHVEKKQDAWLINQEIAGMTVEHLSERKILIRKGHKQWEVELTHVNKEEKQVQMVVSGQTLTATVTDRLDELLNSLGMQGVSKKVQNFLEAPMPGKIVSVEVTEGQTIAAGDPLVVLEAMKMENVIKAKSAAVIKKVFVEQGQTVEKKAKLIEMGPVE